MIEHALQAIERGWHVYPLAAGTKVPPRGTDGPKSATTDPAIVEQWFDHGKKWGEGEYLDKRNARRKCDLIGNKDFNYGIATGPSGLVVIDIDVMDDHASYDPQEPGELFGGDAWSWMIFNHGLQKQPLTYEVWSPSGGEHFYFEANKAAPVKTATAKLAPGIDVRAINGTIVGQGSKIKGKGTYELRRNVTPKPLPAWLRSLLGQAGMAGTSLESRPRKTTPPPRVTNASKYATAAFDSEIAELRRTPIGQKQRNKALNAAAFKLRRFVDSGELDLGEVADSLYVVATGDLSMNRNEVVATINSGLGIK